MVDKSIRRIRGYIKRSNYYFSKKIYKSTRVPERSLVSISRALYLYRFIIKWKKYYKYTKHLFKQRALGTDIGIGIGKKVGTAIGMRVGIAISL